MKALVFAAGLGTRLKPFTFSHPKALVPVGGVPMLQRVIEKLKHAGVDEIVVNVHHFASQITDFLSANNNFGIKIDISDETSCLLETGGGILKARKFLDGNEPFIVHNADILTDFPLQEMIKFHVDGNADATLLVAPRTTSRYLCFNSENRLVGWENKSTKQTLPEGFTPGTDTAELAFGGVHILSPSIYSRLENFTAEKSFSIIPFYVDSCAQLIIKGYTPSVPFRWHDIGKPESLEAANRDFL